MYTTKYSNFVNEISRIADVGQFVRNNFAVAASVVDSIGGNASAE